MADVLRRGADDGGAGSAAQFHRVIRNQPVAALHQLHRRLAFAHAAVAQNQDALAVHLHAHAMAGHAGGQLHIQVADQVAHQRGGGFGRAHQGHIVPAGKVQHFIQRVHPAGNDHGGGLHAEQLFQMVAPLIVRQVFQIRHLHHADDLNSGGVKILIKACQHNAGAVDVRRGDGNLPQVLGGVQALQVQLLCQFSERD